MKQSRKAKIIVIEGADRCGKATQTRLLRESLEKQGFSAKTVEVPIKTAITYRIIYWMLKNGLAKKLPKTFQVFQFLNRKFFQWFTLPSLECEFKYIILDRWSLSTIVYGGAEGVSQSFTVGLSKFLRCPDHTVILLGESFPHDAEDVYEADLELQKKVREGYTQWALRNFDTTSLHDCRQEKRVLSKKIQALLKAKNIIPTR